MNKEVIVTDSSKSIRETALLMKSRKIGCVVSVENGMPTGILTERDILNKVVAPGRDAASMKVSDVMTKNLVFMSSERTIQEAVDILDRKRIKRLPVVEQGRLVGIVTMTDLLKALRRLESEESKSLKKAVRELDLTKIRLQSKIIELEERLSRLR